VLSRSLKLVLLKLLLLKRSKSDLVQTRY
jgi:hypothetical protein